MHTDSSKSVLNEQGMEIYDYIVNNVGSIGPELPDLIMKLNECDLTGQFLASSARYLYSVGPEEFRDHVSRLVECAIAKDRERKYIGSLLEAIWGKDYLSKVDELRETDDNFRRIYRRIYADGEF